MNADLRYKYKEAYLGPPHGPVRAVESRHVYNSISENKKGLPVNALWYITDHFGAHALKEKETEEEVHTFIEEEL